MRLLIWTAAACGLLLACGDDSTGGGGSGANGGAGGTGNTGGTGAGTPEPPTVAECAATCQAALDDQCVQLTDTDCTGCCDAGLAVTDCLPEAAAFHECASSGDPCTVDCDEVTDNLIDCLTTYCLANGEDPNCDVLVGCRAPQGTGGAGGAGGGAGG